MISFATYDYREVIEELQGCTSACVADVMKGTQCCNQEAKPKRVRVAKRIILPRLMFPGLIASALIPMDPQHFRTTICPGNHAGGDKQEV